MEVANRDTGNHEDVTSLLKEIRDELRTNNELLKQTKATAPYEDADETEEPNIV